MQKRCHACHGELDPAALALGKCPHCGAVFIKLAHRTIEDKRPRRDQQPGTEKTTDLSIGDSESISLEVPFGTNVFELKPDQPRPEQTREGSSADTGAPDKLPPEPGQEKPAERKALTVGQESDATILLEPAAESSDHPPTPRRSTHSMESDRTIDLEISADEARHIDKQWHGTFDQGAGLGQTIRQRETVTGFRSSLPVKSRYIRERRETPTPPPATPAEVPDYELLDIIGEGGMGVVYAAHQSSIARTVAVKMLKPSAKEREGQRDKFISEAVVTGELDHPNIVPIYDLGANDEGALFYSMKRVRGTPWDKVIHQKQLDENLSILMRVADAVAFAHANGVIHRDLKPENVMLGDYGEVLVMDWGLARITPEFAHAHTVYQSDNLGGTPAYMAPEMASGPVEKINRTSDIYLLGAILYEIIGGQPPHSGRDVMQCLMAASQNRIDPIRYEGELKDIALKAMATHQEDRYQSVKEFQEAIRTYQSHSESLVLTAHANQNLQKARTLAEGKQQDRAKDAYQLFARALYGFQEALALWEGNQRARALLAETGRDYARCALGNGDLDLAASLLDTSHAEHQQLMGQIESARAERDARQRRLRLAKRAVAALAAVVVATITVAYFVVSHQKNLAVAARDAAELAKQQEELAKHEAVQQRDAAEMAKKQEELAKLEAVQQRDAAELARKNEALARQEEEKQRKAAQAAEKAALEAKEREEYEAYIAQIGLAAAKIDENAYDYALQLLEDSNPQLRNWEWGRLVHLCQLSAAQFPFSAPVNAVAYSPDGEWFAAGDFAGRLTVRHVQTGKVRWQSAALGQYIFSVAYSPDGRLLASGGDDKTIRIFDASTGQELHTLVGHRDGVLSVRFSPDGKQLLSGSYDNTARLWDLASRQTVQEFTHHTWWVWATDFSPNSERIVTAGQDGRAIVWQRRLVSSEPASHSENRGTASPTPATRTEVSSSPRDVYDRLTEFNEHKGAIYSAKFSPDGKFIATGGYDKMVMIWDPDSVRPIDVAKRLDNQPQPQANVLRLAGHDGPVRSVAFSPQGHLALSGSEDNTIRVWDLTAALAGSTGSAGVEPRPANKVLRGHGGAVRSCVFSPDGQRVLSGGDDQSARLWNLQGYEEVRVLHATVFSGHEDAVLAARYSADGQHIVTASRDRTASLWRAATGEPLRRFEEGHEFLVTNAAFFTRRGDNDSLHHYLATGAGDNSVRVWDVTAGTQQMVLYPTGRIGAVAVSPDGRWIATGSIGNDVQIWDAAPVGDANHDPSPVAILRGHSAEVSALAFSPSGDLLASGGYAGRLRLWKRENKGDAVEWKFDRELVGHSGTITSLRFTPDGRRLVSASGDHTCGQWDIATGQELRDLVLKHPEWVTSLDLSPDGSQALTTCEDGTARLWRLEDATLLAAVRAPGEPFNAASFSLDGNTAVLTSAEDKRVWLWDLSAERADLPPQNATTNLPIPIIRSEPLLDFNQLGGEVWSAMVAPDGRHLLTLGGNDAQLWQLDSRKSVVRYSPHGAVASVAISPDGRLLATGSWDHSAKIWDVATGRALRKLEGGHSGYINSVEFSSDGRQLLTASDDGTARLWDVDSGAPTNVVLLDDSVPRARVLSATFSPAGDRVLTASSDKKARIWNRATGQLLVTLGGDDGHRWAVLCARFSPDGTSVITGSQDKTAKIWDAQTGKLLRTLVGHTAAVTSVAVSPNGTRALTGSQDNITKLWDFATGKEILSLPGHTQEVTSVSFSPDGLNVLTASRDGTAIIWLAVPWQGEGRPVLGALPRHR